MKKIDLNGIWEYKSAKEQEWKEISIPGSIYAAMLNEGMENPYEKDNELEIRDICQNDFEVTRKYFLSEEEIAHESIRLCFEGVDTLADVSVNGHLCMECENMHRIYETEVKHLVKAGENKIRLRLYSPIQYIKRKDEEEFLWGIDCSMRGYPHLRKAHYMFGWDWGPMLPDMGIYRPVSLKLEDTLRLKDVFISQEHKKETGEAILTVCCQVEWINRILKEKNSPAEISVRLTSPAGDTIETKAEVAGEGARCSILVKNPMLWWPRGYGEQHLYEVQVGLHHKGNCLEEKTYRIGLRTLTVSRERDSWGEEFCFVINGHKMFSMGADYIPEDNILSRCSKEKTEQLIRSCVKANHNTIRVWGGGFYPEDYFYELCDQYGLIVWQDFMYACGVYDLTDSFRKNIEKETIDAVVRLRHHPCLGLFCGNNEMELAWAEWDIPKDERLKQDYIEQFERLIKGICKKYAPQTFYWPASPSSGGGFVNPNDENRGDVHYWEVWHGNQPFTVYRKYFFRYCSEFGFESLPHIDTIRSVVEEGECNLTSYQMEHHQKCPGGNTKILTYLAENYKMPKNFEATIYASQILQADAIRYGVEHWRRFRGRCMGAIYWQLNDCWPGSSWSGIDYYGRWKALHYASGRFFAPILLSAHEKGSRVTFNVSNETMGAVKGQVVWSIRDNENRVLKEGAMEAELPMLSAKDLDTVDVKEWISTKSEQRTRYLCFAFLSAGEMISSGTLLFCQPKHFSFKKPDIQFRVKDNGSNYEITVQSDVFAKYVSLDIPGEICSFSDNFFDITEKAGRNITVEKRELKKEWTDRTLEQNIKTMSVYEIAEDI